MFVDSFIHLTSEMVPYCVKFEFEHSAGFDISVPEEREKSQVAETFIYLKSVLGNLFLKFF